MSFRTRLAGRIHMNDIHEICYLTQGNNRKKEELYRLLFDADDAVACNAAWVFTHFNLHENEWLYDKQDEIIDEVLVCANPSKRRLLLALLYRQPMPDPPRVDFLNFCMERMVSKDELPGVHSVCVKLAYELCRPIPELLRELQTLLSLMEPDFLSPALRCARKNVLKAIHSSLGQRV